MAIPINYTVLAFGRTKYRPVFHGTYFCDGVGFLVDLTTDESKQHELLRAIASAYYHTEWKHAQESSWPLQFKLWYESCDNNISCIDIGTYTVQLSEVPTFIISEEKES